MREENLKSVIKCYILFLLACCNASSVTHKKYQNVSATEHLRNERIKDICRKIDFICSSSFMKLCTLRMVNGKLQFKEFENHCYLFLYNMCKYPNNEWAIKDVGSCKNLNLRRYAEELENTTDSNNHDTEVTETAEPTTDDITELTTEPMTDENTKVPGNVEPNTEENAELVTDDNTEADNTELTTDENAETTNDTIADVQSATNPALRSATRTTYGVDLAPDDHPCPYHCPSVYSPVCTNINRGYGKYYRLLFFVNHCEADKHYCLHWEEEYKPPPYEDYELVNRPSNAAWSYCAGNKYMNFATFAESAASLGHYGWLMGDQKPSHIMEPYERVPGFG